MCPNKTLFEKHSGPALASVGSRRQGEKATGGERKETKQQGVPPKLLSLGSRQRFRGPLVLRRTPLEVRLSFSALVTASAAVASSIPLITILFSATEPRPTSPRRLGAQTGKPVSPLPAGFLPAADGCTEGAQDLGEGERSRYYLSLSPVGIPQRWPFTQQHPRLPFPASSSSARNNLAASAHRPR